MNPVLQGYLMHYGMPRRSGRYPWGSGEHPYQHSGDFLSRVEELRRQDFEYTDAQGKIWKGDTAIAKYLGLSTTEFRVQMSLAGEERRSALVETAKGLREKGYSLNEIAEKMGYENDSSVRSLLNESSEVRMNKAKATVDLLKKAVDEKGMIDVSAGVERELGISKEKLKEALYILQREGYEVYSGGLPQVTNPGQQTNRTVLCPPGTQHKDIYDYENVHSYKDYTSYDDGDSYRKAFEYPESMDSKRLQIRYAEDGGINKDGVIEIRRGVEDLSLGNSTYAQVRILVDGDRYLKGMAVYSDNMPDGIDVIFNTNKSKDVAMRDVLKEIHDDPDNPFGSLIKEIGGQSYYDDPNGKYTDPITGKKQSLSLINKRAEEGDWDNWAKKIPSQFLSKQSMNLINKQLTLTAADKYAEYDEICSLTNPTVKKALLKSFSDDCDAAAVHLKAAALPRQRYQVILPMTTIKDTEVYAPNYNDGETVALVRYPHAGTFEIPVLKVNNKLKEGKSVLGTNPTDAIGISKAVADRLSGADFDGDTVAVIPCNSSKSKVKITTTEELPGLKGFEPKVEYGTIKKGDDYYNSNGQKIKVMKNTQTEMGKISNLITDMTLRGATDSELARAVRHSMVVIDAEKHKLDYKTSYEKNGIAALKKKYQGRVDEDGTYHEGAYTLISRAKSETSVPKRKGSPKVNQKGKSWYDETKPEGALVYKTVKEEYTDKTGKTRSRTQKSTAMAETSDARTLSTGTPQENAYADYANKMKSLANTARKEMVSTGRIKYSASAKETYKNEVASLDSKLKVAQMNAPRERQAQTMANAVISAKKKQNPDMTKSEIKKQSQMALAEARRKVGADSKGTKITISDREWEAIQAGAISENKLTSIINHTNIDDLRQRATPRKNSSALNTAQINRIKAYAASGHTNAEIAKALGISASTVSKYLK